ncbi:MAG: hypothetical protein A3G21_14665 [Acidobacteria bacterium RIFCSPLOWO2_12_FULL_66_21]|nr:MAG: hypothetical protein A3G21_14665 [Acidobacteria bacterium RIFCSPLOWO2_12_FULL_66_21]
MQDLRDAFRALKATPVVSIVAIVSLALGIGANTAIFSILDALLLRSLPVKDPQRLAVVQAEGEQFSSWTNPIWEQIRDRQGLFDGALAWGTERFNTAASGETAFVDGLWVSGGFFERLGVPAMLGRTFTESDDRRGGGPDGAIAVISYRYWQRGFGGAGDVVGRSLTIERVPFTIVGVAPPEFLGPEIGQSFDVAIPLGIDPVMRGSRSRLDARSMWWLDVMARLKPGQSADEATRALRGVQPQILEATKPDNWRPDEIGGYLKEPFVLAPAASVPSPLGNRYQRPLIAIMVVVGLVLLIACVNIANLLVARATARRHELSVRLALGASRLRLMRQLFAESLLLAATGAAFGLLFAHWGSRLLIRQFSTPQRSVILDLGLDWRVLLFTAGVAGLTVLIFGTAPAFGAMRVQPNEALKEQGRNIAGDRRVSLGAGLVVVQVALSVVLVVAAALFVRTFAKLAHLNLGFERDRVLVVNTNLQRSRVDPATLPARYEQLREAVAGVPGVESASASAVTPVSGNTWQFSIELPGKPPLPRERRGTYVNVVSPDFFRTLGTRILAGRDLGAADSASAPAVALVNQRFVRQFFGGEQPLGQKVRLPGRPNRPAVDLEVVGLVEDAVYRSLRSPVPPTLYVALAQQRDLGPGMSISVRSATRSPALLTRPVAAALMGVDPDAALTFQPLAAQVNNSLVQERVVAILSAFFGGLALLLAGLGLYGVTAYAVGRRRAEIGVRMALGSTPGAVVRLVLARVAVLVAIGIAAGTGLSLWLSRLVASLLFGLEPREPLTFVFAAVVLGSVGALAGWLPARRASHIDPARVLREG